MSENWDFYLLQVDDKPASIFVDLGIFKSIPISTHSQMAYVRVLMRSPGPDGLSSQGEFEALQALEDHLEQELVSEHCLYVGRNTSDGCRDFYFYLTRAASWTQDVDRAMSSFSEYKFEADTRDDAEWNVYSGFLYPGPMDLQRIRNRRTCEALQGNGDGLSAQRPIDHWAYFHAAADRARFVESATALGCSVAETWEPDNEHDRFGVRLSARGVPSFEKIDDLTMPLWKAARECGGEYDGWETEVVS